jgi:hypothetical protein
MNQRIQQLADKIWAEEYWENPNTDKLLPAQLNKFAQLIVQECANQCDLLLNHRISSEWSRGTHDCSRAIKQHFGVEQ